MCNRFFRPYPCWIQQLFCAFTCIVQQWYIQSNIQNLQINTFLINEAHLEWKGQVIKTLNNSNVLFWLLMVPKIGYTFHLLLNPPFNKLSMCNLNHILYFISLYCMYFKVNKISKYIYSLWMKPCWMRISNMLRHLGKVSQNKIIIFMEFSMEGYPRPPSVENN